MWYILEATILPALSIPISFCFYKTAFYNPDNRGSGLTGHRVLPGTMVSIPEKKNPFSSISHLQPLKAARDLQLWLFSEGLPVPDEVSSSSLLSA